MKRAIKWLFIVGGTLFVLIVAALLIIPLFVDVQHYKPQIEKLVSEKTGRPFTLGGDLDFSLFPWAGVALSDVRMGNPPGFKEKDFASVKSFEVRVKLLPLLSKDVQLKRFVLEEPRIVLEKTKAGRWNFEGIGKPAEGVAKPEVKKSAPTAEGKPQEGLPIKSLAVGELAIKNASIVVLDHATGKRQEVSNVNLRLENVSLDRPIHMTLSALVLGQPVSLDGKIGPVGTDPGKGTMPVELAVQAFKELDMTLKGTLADLAKSPRFDLDLKVSPFSPRKVLVALGQSLPVKTADPEVLDDVALEAKVKGTAENVSVSSGALDLDDSKLTFSTQVKDFAKPDVKFSLELDQIDVDRYLPKSDEGRMTEEAKTAPAPVGQKRADYGPLRSLVLDGVVKIGALSAKGAKIQDLNLKVSGKNGRFQLDPLTLKLYQGEVSAKGLLDVQQQVPRTNMDIDAKGIQAGPLLNDVMKTDFLEGVAKAEIGLQMTGDDAEQIKRSLNGKGNLLFKDGAIKGIDLPGMVRNAKAAFGLAEKGTERPRTDFSEVHVPFTITNGLANTPKTSLMSPLLRVVASGDADLVKETLDFRVEPKFVATLKGQEDTMERSGLMVPVLVTGSFSSPKFRPDLKGMLTKELEGGVPEASDLKKLLPTKEAQEGESKPLEEKAKGLIKGLPFGQ